MIYTGHCSGFRGGGVLWILSWMVGGGTQYTIFFSLGWVRQLVEEGALHGKHGVLWFRIFP